MVFSKEFLLVIFFYFLFFLSGCKSPEKQVYEFKKFSDYMKMLKKRNWVSVLEISILEDSTVRKEYRNLFEGICFYLPCNEANKIRELILKHSFHSNKPVEWCSIDWAASVVIKIYGENPIYVYIDPTGFSFDTNQALTGFCNPELANYLVGIFNKAGLYEISKIFKENKYLYESYIEADYKRYIKNCRGKNSKN